MNYAKLSTLLGIVAVWGGGAYSAAAQAGAVKERKISEAGFCVNYDHSCKTRSIKLEKGRSIAIHTHTFYNLPFPVPVSESKDKQAATAELSVYDHNNKKIQTYTVAGYSGWPRFKAPESGLYRMEVKMPNNVHNNPYVWVWGYGINK